MTVKLGMFTMPFHHPDRNYADLLAEDQEAVVLADQLGLLRGLCRRALQLVERADHLAAHLPRHRHLARPGRSASAPACSTCPRPIPATVAAHAAMFDQLSGGRFIMGIGPGGLVSDLEMFEVGQAELRPQMVQESIDIVLKLWAQDPPYEIDGRFWKFALKNGVWPEFKVGYIPRPLQQPHPPIALSIITPNSVERQGGGGARVDPHLRQLLPPPLSPRPLGEVPRGCEAVGRRPDPDVWRVSRSILVTETDAEAEEYLADPDSGLSFYYKFFIHSFAQGRKALFMIKPDVDLPDERTTVDAVKRGMIIAGSPRRVLDQLVALRDEIGHFGTLLMAGHDWDRPALWRRSMELLARDVMPRFACARGGNARALSAGAAAGRWTSARGRSRSS